MAGPISANGWLAVPARAHEIEAAFDGRSSAKRKTRVDEVLRLLAETGGARAAGSDPEPRYFVAR